MRNFLQAFNNVTLRKKLYTTIALILLVPTITVGLFSYNSSKEEITDLLLTSAEENVKLLNSNINNTMEPKLYDVNFFSKQISAETYGDFGLTSPAMVKFTQYIGLHPEVQVIYVGTNDGKTISLPNNLPEDYDPRERHWFQDAKKQEGKVIVSSPYKDVATGSMVVTISKTTEDGSGVVALDLTIATLEDTTSEIKIGKQGYAILLDSQRNYIVSPDAESGSKAEDDFIENLYKEESGIAQYDHNGQNKFMYFETNKSTGWKLGGTMYYSEVDNATDPIWKTTIIVISIAIIVGALLTILIVKSIVDRTKKLQSQAKKISEGDLTEVITNQSKDEIGQLSASFADMQTSLKKLLLSMDNHAVQVAASAEELTASAMQTSEATEQVATAIQEVAASAEKQTINLDYTITSLEKISTGTTAIAESTNEVFDLTNNTTIKAEEGNESVKQTVNQMNVIHDSVTESNKMIRTLYDRSKEIGAILSAITAIADQTNLLALNAAIEAARAGESGKGFAVVADEVRKLAEQSQSSAKQIAELIHAIQMDTERTVQKMTDVVDNVKNGLVVSEDAIEKFTEIFDSMKKITPKMDHVSFTIQHMVISVKEVEDTVYGISDIAKGNAAASEEVAASTEEQLAAMEEIASSSKNLASMAESMQQNIKKYKV